MAPWKGAPMFPKKAFIKHSSALSPLRWVRWGERTGPTVTITTLKAARGERNPGSQWGTHMLAQLLVHCPVQNSWNSWNSWVSPQDGVQSSEPERCWDTAKRRWARGKLMMSNCAFWTLGRGFGKAGRILSLPRGSGVCADTYFVWHGGWAGAQMVSSDHPRSGRGEQGLSDIYELYQCCAEQTQCWVMQFWVWVPGKWSLIVWKSEIRVLT